MPSEQHLHPASILFAFATSLRKYALPGVLLMVTAGRSSSGRDESFGYMPANWELYLMLLLIPSLLLAILRYLSFRIRYDGTELVIRTGLIFRNERHVPYARIQNLDAVQNVFHRALDVVEVRVETGGGREPEARISVLPSTAFAEMRRRVFEGRTVSAMPEAAAEQPAAQTLLHLPMRELLLFGFLENRGLVLIAAAYGAAWELGLLQRMWGNVFDDPYIPYVVPTSLVEPIFRGGALSAARGAMLLVAVAALLVVVRIVSMAWGVVRLHDFRLARAGEDLHTRFGLLTRVATTIPLRRVQTLTIRQGPLHQLVHRTSVQAVTAGGSPQAGGSKTEREWLAPLIREADLGALVRHVMPALDITSLEWHPPHPRAVRRVVKPALAMAALATVVLALAIGWWALFVLPFGIVSAVIWARQYVAHLAWTSNDEVVALRSGWLWRTMTIARVVKIQAVTQLESPFDRRTVMARVRVDTAGASPTSHRVDIPFLARETAQALHARLAANAAATTFQ